MAAAAPTGELFASRSSEREGLARLVERLQARLGAVQVQSLAPVPDHRPECGTCWQPADPARLGVHTGAHVGAHAGAQPALHTLALTALAAQPLWLLPEPLALRVRAQAPLFDGQPLRRLAGPERLESGWWDDQGPALRDYFIAQVASGALVWVYRQRVPTDAAGTAWYLHGLFG